MFWQTVCAVVVFVEVGLCYHYKHYDIKRYEVVYSTLTSSKLI